MRYLLLFQFKRLVLFISKQKINTDSNMNAQTNSLIDWSNPDVLQQIVQNIKNPLDKIMETSKRNKDLGGLQFEVIFSSSKQISDIMENFLNEIKAKSVTLTIQENPDIFDIYNANKNVQKMCSKELTQEKLNKVDVDWLMNLEKEIYQSITKNDINICDLSYKMAVSERQLHRKIDNLLHLTPNKYIRILRLHKAKSMIDHYIQNSISQLAYAVGYNDVHYFSKLFFCQYDISPKELINSLK